MSMVMVAMMVIVDNDINTKACSLLCSPCQCRACTQKCNQTGSIFGANPKKILTSEKIIIALSMQIEKVNQNIELNSVEFPVFYLVNGIIVQLL